MWISRVLETVFLTFRFCVAVYDRDTYFNWTHVSPDTVDKIREKKFFAYTVLHYSFGSEA